MKIRNLLAILLLSGAATTTVVAQEGSPSCNSNISISHEAVGAGNYRDAYIPWKEVLEECPTLRFYIYSDGFKILKAFLDEDDQNNNKARTSAEYKKYFDELMETHDLRIKYIPDFASRMSGVPSVTDGLNAKVVDYITYAPSVDVNVAYEWLSQVVNEQKGKSSGSSLHYFVDMSMRKLRQNEAHREQFIQDYLNAAEYADQALAAAEKESDKERLGLIKENLVALFINSGAADCASLQNIYSPKIEENKTDLDYLKKVISIMRMMGCTDEEAYLQASLYSYQIQPTAEAAVGCAYMAYKRGDNAGTVKFFDEAINLETDNLKKADYAYRAAAVLYADKKYSQSRSYAQKAISFNANYGAPYILIATLYASSPNWSDEPALNKCTYFLVLDKLNRAKAVDPSVSEEANKLIRTYSQYTPAASDLFMQGYKVGDQVKIGGWIGETTTIR